VNYKILSSFKCHLENWEASSISLIQKSEIEYPAILE